MKNVATAMIIALVAAMASSPTYAATRTVLLNTSKYKLDIEVHFGRYVKSEVVRPFGRLTLPEGKSYLAVLATDERGRRICNRTAHVSGERAQIVFSVSPQRTCEFSRPL